MALAHYPNRQLILITDGVDNASKITKADLIAEVQKEQVPIYAIGIGNPKASHFPAAIGFGPWTIGGGAQWADADTLGAIAGGSPGRSFVVPPISKDNGAGLTEGRSRQSARW